MHLRSIIAFPLVLTAVLAGGFVCAADVVGDRASAEQRLIAAGYRDVRDIEYDHGIYEAEVRRADGRYTEVAIAAENGEIFDAQDGRMMLDADRVRAALGAAGYREVRDLERDGALWDAEALDRDGVRVELRVSAFDAHVVSVATDDDGDDD